MDLTIPAGNEGSRYGDNIFVDLNGESQRDLLRNSGTAPVASGQADARAWAKQHAVLSSAQHATEMQQR
jgi:hypothetical protein